MIIQYSRNYFTYLTQLTCDHNWYYVTVGTDTQPLILRPFHGPYNCSICGATAYDE